MGKAGHDGFIEITGNSNTVDLYSNVVTAAKMGRHCVRRQRTYGRRFIATWQ